MVCQLKNLYLQLMATKRKRGHPSITTKTNQEELLKAALKAFALSGYEGTNIKQLGEEAGIAPSLFYYHFKDKIGLWQKSIQLVAKELNNKLTLEDLSDPLLDNSEIIKKWISSFIYFSAKNPEFHQVISYEMSHPSPRADWLIDNILKPLHQNLLNLISTMEMTGYMKKIPIASFVSILIGSANVFFTQAYQTKKLYQLNVFEKKIIQQHTETVISILFDGIIKK